MLHHSFADIFEVGMGDHEFNAFACYNFTMLVEFLRIFVVAEISPEEKSVISSVKVKSTDRLDGLVRKAVSGLIVISWFDER